MILGPDDFFSSLPQLIWHEDEPLVWPSSVSLFFVSRLASEKVKVVLTGEGGDELFAGYLKYRVALWNLRGGPLYRKVVPRFLQQTVRKVLVARPVAAYAVKLVRATRPGSDEAPDFVKKYLTWGAGPRACQALLLGGKAHALLDGRVHVSTEDIRYVARPVLRHRLATSFRAESDGVSADHIVEKLFQVVREPMER